MLPHGPTNAPVVIVTDYPSPAERATQQPLNDYAGGLFFDLLSRAGMMKNNCLVVSLLDSPPPEEDLDKYLSKRKTCPGPEWGNVNGKWVAPELAKGCAKLKALLEQVNPVLVISLGEASLWALTGYTGITKWRSSRLQVPQWPFTILPTYHPRGLVRDPALRHIFQIDLARAKAG